jgi:hypothetical protein
VAAGVDGEARGAECCGGAAAERVVVWGAEVGEVQVGDELASGGQPGRGFLQHAELVAQVVQAVYAGDQVESGFLRLPGCHRGRDEADWRRLRGCVEVDQVDTGDSQALVVEAAGALQERFSRAAAEV